MGCGVLAGLCLVAVAGPWVAPWGWRTPDFSAFRQPPSAAHWFGTTGAGQDVFALTVRGLRKSLVIGLGAAACATGAAAVAGSFAGYLGGWADRMAGSVADLVLVLPAFLLVAVLAPVAGGHWAVLTLLLAAVMWPVTARMVRTAARGLRSREYVVAARFMGVSAPRVVGRHVLPHLASLLVADAALNVSAAVLGESGLSYLGLGVQPPDGSLGTVLAAGSPQATTYPWLFVPAAVLLVLLVLAVNLVGDGLRDLLDRR